ncbi:hypothetical protein [uncultured Psychroserpens sp.]|uniref:hypothetical protein n=1 Tax=uncultured Psychroserpens sp. TaxID=255436 RepID=UPI002620438A|nr:hypothetical protein [uncultured Psychroserpens sp.]
MGKKNKPLDIENLRITSKPQFLISLITIVSIVTVHFVTFLNMKEQISENTNITKEISKDLADHRTEFYKEFSEIKVVTSNIQGRLTGMLNSDKDE